MLSKSTPRPVRRTGSTLRGYSELLLLSPTQVTAQYQERYTSSILSQPIGSAIAILNRPEINPRGFFLEVYRVLEPISSLTNQNREDPVYRLYYKVHLQRPRPIQPTPMSTFVKASCHCGLNVLNISFTTTSLPLSSMLCHCNDCRHCTGQMVRNYIPFDGEPLSFSTNEPIDFKYLTEYHTSSRVTRWFCSTCSAHLMAKSTKRPNWYVTVGALERMEGIVKTQGHIWVGSTLDGGLADYLQVVDGQENLRYTESEFQVADGGTLPVGWRGVTEENHAPDQLSAHCHCNAISFSITRPSSVSTQLTSPYPDLLFPHDTTPASKLTNPDDEKWWLRPVGLEGPTRYLAGFCACRSCRLVTGSEIQSWAFIPRSNITIHSDKSSVEFDPLDEIKRPNQLKRYDSSPGRHRESCGNCGANVFFWSDLRRDLIAVSAGLFNEKQGGVRAEGWLEWYRERVSFSEQAVRKTMVDALVGHR